MPVRPPVHRPPGWRPYERKPADNTAREYGTQRWRKLARSIIDRDRGICHLCGQPGADTAHHLVEKRDGGTDAPSNLQAVHRGCHNRSHGRRG